MSLQACADLVRRGDPNRFAAAMAAPVEARRVLFPLYAFNLEVARAPWVASEPMIGEMRLQWWRDALEEMATEGPVRRHEVTTPLAEAIDAQSARELDALVAARRWDLYTEPFEDETHFLSYLGATGGALMWAAARALGAQENAGDAVRAFGNATAFVRYMAAVPDLEARGRIPLVDGRAEAIGALARRMSERCPTKLPVPKPARAALLEGWQTRSLLKLIAGEPHRVAEGRVRLSEFRKRLGLFRASF